MFLGERISNCGLIRVFKSEKIYKYKDYIVKYDKDRDVEFIYGKPMQLVFIDEKDDTGITILGTREGITKFMDALDSFDPCTMDELKCVGFRLWKKEYGNGK